MQFDHGDDIVRVKSNEYSASQDLYLPLRHLRRQPERARRGGKVLLQNLQQNDSRSAVQVLRKHPLYGNKLRKINGMGFVCPKACAGCAATPRSPAALQAGPQPIAVKMLVYMD